ncbi:protease3 [Bacteroidales bacterium Barb6]|nr:protease3 [Bacteroidales bacterium Barb6]
MLTKGLFSQISSSLHVREYMLSNGMTVWLNEDRTLPKVLGAVLVKAGAKDSPDTGIPHYFEHIMFKGTDKIGTLDYEAEKVLLDAIEAKYDELAQTKNEKKRLLIQQAINELGIQAAEHVIPNEFDRLISRYGGTRLNAGTSYDYTVYYNTFSPQYMAQWAEINSERLINPVFRLFQNELETVYEEKNMHGDAVGGQAMEKLTERYFSPHPYAYPIIGSTKNLKNPRLSEMRKFFEEYYVASNMGLILCGDFRAEEVLPVLEKTFSRIRAGEAPLKEAVALPPFKGREKVKVKVPVPMVKLMALGFRGVPANHEDQVALNIAVGLLTNSNGTGYLDKLMVDRKVLSTMAMNESLNEAGMLGIVVAPKLSQSYSKAEKLAWEAINRVKAGDFSDEVFRSLKLEQKREYASGLEDINARAQVMMTVFSQGKRWEDYIDNIACIEALTKEDVVAAACKYFTGNYLHVTKRTGKYPKEHLPKPSYKPVNPANRDASSAFARQLEEIPVRQLEPRFIDFAQDAATIALSPLAVLYATPNPVNDIFTLTLSYGVGAVERPELSYLANYLNYLGTETLPFDVFRNSLQVIGSTLSFEASDHDFQVKVTGFDNHFGETLELLAGFLTSPQADESKMPQMVEEIKVMEKTLFKSGESMGMVLMEKVRYGNLSRFLVKWPLAKVKKLKGAQLLQFFAEVQQTECDLHYCGMLPPADVAARLTELLPLDRITNRSLSPFYREPVQYDKPTVFFFNMPDLAQSIVYSYIRSEQTGDVSSRNVSKLFTGYFGGDMSSLMFQEIREFRSYAYRVDAQHFLPPFNHSGKPGEFVTMLSTQSDKTTDAIAVLDSLLRDMPVRPDRIEGLKQAILNRVNNEFASFRKLSAKIASFRREGYDSDPNKLYLNDLHRMSMDDILRFYESNVKGSTVIYAVVGSAKRIDMKRLSTWGTVVKVKKKDIYR